MKLALLLLLLTGCASLPDADPEFERHPTTVIQFKPGERTEKK